MVPTTRWRRLLLTICIGAVAAGSGCATFTEKLPWRNQQKLGATAATNFDSPLSLARLNERHGQVESARLVYEAVLRNDPHNVVAHHRLGVIAAKRRQFDKAEEHFQKALAAGEPSAELLTDLGYLAYLQDRLDEAEERLRQALELSPTSRTARTNLALVLGEQGRFGECLNEFRRVGTEAQAHANLAYVYAMLGELEQAEQEYHRALALDPTLLPAADALSQLAERRRALRPRNLRPRLQETRVATLPGPVGPRRLPTIEQSDPLIASVSDGPARIQSALTDSGVSQASATHRPQASSGVQQASFSASTQPITSISVPSPTPEPAPWSQPTWTPNSNTLSAPTASIR